MGTHLRTKNVMYSVPRWKPLLLFALLHLRQGKYREDIRRGMQSTGMGFQFISKETFDTMCSQLERDERSPMWHIS